MTFFRFVRISAKLRYGAQPTLCRGALQVASAARRAYAEAICRVAFSHGCENANVPEALCWPGSILEHEPDDRYDNKPTKNQKERS